MTYSPWFWWFLGSGGSFLILEGYAILNKTPTLSATVRAIADAYPWTAGAITIAAFLLLAHFFLRWF